MLSVLKHQERAQLFLREPGQGCFAGPAKHQRNKQSQAVGLGRPGSETAMWLLGVLCPRALGGFLSVLSLHPVYEWYQQRLQETSQLKFSPSLERPSILLVHIL